MNTVLQNLFNNGINNGDFTIYTQNGELKCHSFVLNYLSTVCKDLINDNCYSITINIDHKIIKIIVNYIYCERICTDDLTIMEIFELFEAINYLKCSNCTILKNYYLPKFLSKLCEDNWIEMLKLVHNNHIILEDIIYKYFTEIILTNANCLNYIIANPIIINDTIQNKLFNIALQHIVNLNLNINEVKNDRDNIMNKILQNEASSDEDIPISKSKKKSKN